MGSQKHIFPLKGNCKLFTLGEKNMGKGSRKPEVSKKKFYVATVSHGKDSAYMVVYLLSHRDKYPLDLVLYVNTGMEFDAVYEARDRCCKMLKNANIPYVEIDIGEAFQHSMFSKPVCKQGTNEVHRIGYSWCGGPCRWGTSLKLQVIDRYCKNLAIMYDVEDKSVCYIFYSEEAAVEKALPGKFKILSRYTLEEREYEKDISGSIKYIVN